MIQDVVPLLAGSDLDKLSQEKRCSLGNGSQFCDVLRLAFQAVDLFRQIDIRHVHAFHGYQEQQLAIDHIAISVLTIILSTMVSLPRM